MRRRRGDSLKNFVTILVLVLAMIPSIYFLSTRMTGFFSFGPANSTDVWWNDTWHYRVKFELDANGYSRQDWPIEINLNFTYMLEGTGTFSQNSTRVFEYNSTGGIMYEVPHQFDKDKTFSSTNEIGTLSFLMNGSTAASAKRFFYLYFDNVGNGYKLPVSYSTDLAYSWDGRGANVNNSLLQTWIDTVRGENASGIYRIRGNSYEVLYDSNQNNKPLEYVRYSNGTYNFSFDLRNNATFIAGPIRIVVDQNGNETLWNASSNRTNEGRINKQYIFYSKNNWFYIYQNFTNLANYPITRNSTPTEALTFDTVRGGLNTIDSPQTGNSTDPFSWHWASTQFGGFYLGVINANETYTTNYFASNTTSGTLLSNGQIGVHLNQTTLSPGNSITEKAAVIANDTSGDYNDIKALINRLANNVIVTQRNQEIITVYISPQTNATIYNRNETAQIIANITYDPYSLVNKTNATIDMGTPSPADDQTIILNYNGTDAGGNKIFVNTFNISNTATPGQWKFNITAYDKDNVYLNITTGSFNVTNYLNVNTTVTNRGGLINRTVFANITVNNYRNDTGVYGAGVVCVYNPGNVDVSQNMTDKGTGNYSLNFTAPAIVGTYSLNCTASKNGNSGWGNDTFYTESAKTYVAASTAPANYTSNSITLDNKDSFVFSSNSNNMGDSRAYSTNISLSLPSGWSANSTLENCGDVPNGTSCAKGFNATIPAATLPGAYNITVNTTWRNPDGSLNYTYTNLTVSASPDPKISVVQTYVSGTVAGGTEKNIGNFTVNSTGNANLNNVTFSVAGLGGFTVTFAPPNISSLAYNTIQNVSINVSVPMNYVPGVYNGTVNASSSNDGWASFNLSITVPYNTSVSVSTAPSNYTSNNVTFDVGESFNVSSSAANTGGAIARLTNISLSLPSGWSANSTLENCGYVNLSSSCAKGFRINIPRATSPASYLTNFTVNWTNPDGSLGVNSATMTVTVNPNPKINVIETNISNSMNAGSQKTIGNFTVNSTGNSNLTTITFATTGLPNMTVTFNPTSISTLPPNTTQTVLVNVSVPLNYLAGNYTGTINVSSSNGGWNALNMTINVLENRTWSMSPTSCQKVAFPDTGTVCEVNVTNLGNAYTNFTISPGSSNNTNPNVTSFSVQAFSSYVFNFTYNVTGQPKGFYNSTYMISASQSGASPSNAALSITLLPFALPTISTNLSSPFIEQSGFVDIYANVTDNSGTGIDWVRMNVTRPNGVVDSANMTFLNSSGLWYKRYADGTFGNTSLKGNYSVLVAASDKTSTVGNSTSSFTVMPKLVIFSSTLSSNYVQGDTGSIVYTAQDVNNQGIGGVRTTITVANPSGAIMYNSSFTTAIDGNVEPMPQFVLPSDALLGNYSLLAASNYTDPSSNLTTLKNTSSSFQVTTRTAGGLFADIETTVAWYPNNIMKFSVLVHNAAGLPVDPDTMGFIVYDPANNPYINITKAQMTRQATGLYNYLYAMPPGTGTGMYLAVLNATSSTFSTTAIKAFRVSQGGPFDVNINPLKFQAYQNDYFNFQLIASNMGDVTQDILIGYAVTDGNGTNYYTASESVLSNARSNMSIVRNAYIFPDQPLGTYYLNVNVTYSNEQPPASANVSFKVIGRPIVPPPPAPIVSSPPITGQAPTPPVPNVTVSNVTIVQYKRNVSLAKGWIDTESVTVQNGGDGKLQNLTFILTGLPSTWYEVTPSVVDSLSPSSMAIFLVKFKIPQTANTSTYTIDLLALTASASDQKRMYLNIYQSTGEVIQAGISNLKARIDKIKSDVDLVQKAGKDVRNVLTLIAQAENEVSQAENSLKNNALDAALDHVSSADSILKQSEDLLNEILSQKILAAAPVNMWLLAVIVIVAAFVTYFAASRIAKKPKEEAVKPLEARRLLEMLRAKKASRSDLELERTKLERSLDLVEKELKAGMINYNVYNEMKRAFEEKLRNIESQLKTVQK